MAQLKALGGLRLEGTAFTRPTALLLLIYLSLEGTQQRRHVAELFWPGGNHMKSLSMTLTRLRQGAGDVIEADDKRTWSTLKSDAKELLEALDKSHWQKANELYTGAFLEGVVLEKWSSELEEWVYTTREYLAERIQYALLNLAEEAAKKQDFNKVHELAERTYKLPGLSGMEVSSLKRLYPLLSASSSLLAPEARKELDGYGITVQLSRDEARATFQGSKATSQLPTRQTSFVGRDVELTELATMLDNVQLLTLLGTAGVGKTRLALQLAHEQQKLGTFEHVYFVSLESLSSVEMIVPTILSALRLTQQGDTKPLVQLTEFIAEHSVLLVLDNLEHLVENANVLSELIQKCSNLKVLVTSRDRLHLEEEHLFPLEGLGFPTVNTSFEDTKTVDAVVLFSQRAQQLQPQFKLETQLEAVLRICKLVEGLPLGLELAASWVRLMSCTEIADEIQRNLDFLTTKTRNVPDRHHSLKAAFDYSWKLLTPKEQEVLRKLSVFVGGFRREAASTVTGATIPLLASLVDKSLLRVLPNGRYDRHPLLYQFTQEKLAENPDEQIAANHRHAGFYLELAEKAEAHFYSGDAKMWLYRFDEELDNVRSILVRVDADTGLRLATYLAGFWGSRGLYQEARGYLTTFLDLVPDKTSSSSIKGLYTLADFAWQQGDFGEARLQLEKALPLARTLDDKNAISRILGLSARIYHYNDSDSTKARALYEESIAVAELAGNKRNKAFALNLMAILVSDKGDYEAAQTFYEESMALWRELGHRSGIAYVLNNLANINDSRGEHNKAEQLFKQSLELFRELGDKEGIAMVLGNLGLVGIAQGYYPKANKLLQESLVMRRELSDKRATADVLDSLGQIAFHHNDYKGVRVLVEEAHALNLQLGYKLGICDSLRFLGDVHYAEGDGEKARQTYEEGLLLCRSINNVWGIANTAPMLAIIEIEQGRYDVARGLLEESLKLAQGMKSQRATLRSLEGLALLETALGRSEKAVYLWGASNTLRQTLMRIRDHIEQKWYETALKQLRQNLGRKFEAMLKEGQRMSLGQALELVSESSGSSPVNTSHHQNAPMS